MCISPKELTKNFVFPLWHDKTLEVIDAYFHPKADIRTTFLVGRGPQAFKESVQDIFKAFPLFVVSIEDVTKEQNKMVYKWRAHAKHDGYLLNIAPTGKEMLFSGVVYGEMEEGLICKYHSFSNIPQVLQQNFSSIQTVASIPCEAFQLDFDAPHLFEEIIKRTGVRLTRREIETLILWLKGYTMKDTAKYLGGISHKTIQSFREKLKKKFQVRSYQQLFNLLLKREVLSSLLDYPTPPSQSEEDNEIASKIIMYA